MRLAVVATAALDQWALDFDGNAARTVASAEEARRQGARYRVSFWGEGRKSSTIVFFAALFL